MTYRHSLVHEVIYCFGFLGVLSRADSKFGVDAYSYRIYSTIAVLCEFDICSVFGVCTEEP